MIWFKGISLLLAVLCLTKAGIAIMASEWFYAWRRRQYASDKVPKILFAIPVGLSLISAISWYFTYSYEVPLDWVISSSLTGISWLGIRNLQAWEDNHLVTVLAIDTHRARLVVVDLGILLLGAFFLCLALLVY